MEDMNLFPTNPGVYIFKNAAGGVIYIGKAKSLRKRVASYFQKKSNNCKIQALLEEYDRVDYIITSSETEAMLLEARLIGEYKPKFNVVFKSGQPFVYILFEYGSMPQIRVVRNKNLRGKYFGPFLHKVEARRVYSYLLRTFQLQLCNKKIKNGCLDYHLGLCAGSCKVNFDKEDYLFRIQMAQDALKYNHKKLLKDLTIKITEHSQNLEFEKAKHLQEYLDNLEIILRTIRAKFSKDKFEDQIFAATFPIKNIYNFSNDIDRQLQMFLKSDMPVRSIDCFDVSHFQSSCLVGSCVRFVNGKPDKNKFRRFKIKTLKTQNDCAALQEIITRRYRNKKEMPDLVMVDGGKGQLAAAARVIPNIFCIGLAKKEEVVFSKKFPNGVKLDIKTDVGKLLIALRDYAHHFAISYHRKRRNKEF